jgi:hypothetical protein
MVHVQPFTQSSNVGKWMLGLKLTTPNEKMSAFVPHLLPISSSGADLKARQKRRVYREERNGMGTQSALHMSRYCSPSSTADQFHSILDQSLLSRAS